MKHKHLVWFLYTEGCPPCKVRQLRYGYRLEDEGYQREIERVMRSTKFEHYERRWILRQVGEI